MMRLRKYFFYFFVAFTFCNPIKLISQDILSMEDAIRIGLESSYSIQIAQNNVEIAQNNNSFGNAGFLPRLDINLNQTNNFQNRYQSNSDGSSTSESLIPTYNLTSGVQLGWTIFDGFGMFIRKEKLGINQEQTDLFLRVEVENSVADIVYTYYNIALNKKLFISYQEQLSLTRNRLTIAREKSKIGVGYELQELQAEVDFRADSAQFIRQHNRVVNLKADLNRLLNREPDVEFTIDITIPVPNQINPVDVYQKIFDNSPAILNARLLSRLGELEVEEAKSLRYPSVSLIGAYNFSRTGTPEGQPRLYISNGPVVGIGATINLFNGFNVSRRVRNAKIAAENQQLVQQNLTQSIKSTAFKLINELNQAIELVRVEEKSVVLALRNSEAAWTRFQLGSISDLELRESQNKLLDAQTRLISAQMSAQAAEIEIRTLTGDLGGFLGR